MLCTLVSYIFRRRSMMLIRAAVSHFKSIQQKFDSIYSQYKNQNVKFTTYIPDEYFQDSFKKVTQFEPYFDQNAFSFSEKSLAKYSKLKKHMQQLPSYIDLLKVFGEYKNFYLSLSAEINSDHQKMQHVARSLTQDVGRSLEHLKQDYISESAKISYLKSASQFQSFFSSIPIAQLPESFVATLLETTSNMNELVVTWNNEYISNGLAKYDTFFNNIDGLSLDKQQRIAVLTDEDSNLVIAGAGSGKTLTISAKVKFLVEHKKVRPDNILLISYTKKSASEMEQRIKERMKLDVDVMTFHKLGMGIIKEASGHKPIVDPDVTEVIKQYFEDEVYLNPEDMERILTFFGVYLNIPTSLDQYDSLGEYHEEHRTMDFESLKTKLQKATLPLNSFKGERMRSLEETLIANFLFLRGVEYSYEKEYEHPTATKNHRQYQPDFYLPEFSIYIEHFGVNKDMKAPWLSEIEEKKYLQGMAWKRMIHQEKETVMIESFSYYNSQGVLLSELEKNLLNHGVVFREVDTKAIFDSILNLENKSQFISFFVLIGTFISLFKSNGYTIDHFDELRTESDEKYKDHPFMYYRNRHFLNLVQPIYTFYQNFLGEKNRIDFNDMINQATDFVNEQELSYPYKYIIVDEYQDISKSRYNLINAIRTNSNAKVMCVGDDWQSIYRFAGSDLDLFIHFESYFGKCEKMKIENTYRNSQELINIAGHFVMKNESQIPKSLISQNSTKQPIEIVLFEGENLAKAFDLAIELIVSNFGDNQHITLLGRSNYDIVRLNNDEAFSYDTYTNKLTFIAYPQLNIDFMTVHKSKGLEADHTILLNAKNDLLGFPNRIVDDPVLSWVLTNPDEYDFAEERRLFYVALTRTKNKLFILAPDEKKSIFVTELLDDHSIIPITKLLEKRVSGNPKCLKCKTGVLVEKINSNNNKTFLACNNFPGCDRTYNDVRILHDQVKCTRCDGYMIIRQNKQNGNDFYGCSNFPDFCNNTMSVLKDKIVFPK